MVWHSDCHLIKDSRLKKIIEKGNVVGFTLSNKCDTREIKINDSFLCLEEFPSCNRESFSINFGGVIYFPKICCYMFGYMSANLRYMDFRVNNIISSCDGKMLCINPFVEPKRILPYTYIVYDNHSFEDGRYNGDMCLFRINKTNSLILPLENNIKSYFKDTALKVFGIELIPVKGTKYKLEVSLGTEKNNNPSDIIYFDLKIISDTDTLDYEIANVFTYRGNNYSLVQNKPKDQCYLGKEFFKRFIKSNFMYDLVKQETAHKRRTRELGQKNT